MELLLFLAFFIAFAIKVPLFPFHTWLPDAHVEAPTAGSVLLAGVLLKMGTYGLIRFSLPLFPNVSHLFAPADFLARDRRNHLWRARGDGSAGHEETRRVFVGQPSGFHRSGHFQLYEQGMEGAVYQMLNHGVSTGALFLLVGMIYERRHTRMIAEFGGLANRMPVYAACFSDRHAVFDRSCRA